MTPCSSQRGYQDVLAIAGEQQWGSVAKQSHETADRGINISRTPGAPTKSEIYSHVLSVGGNVYS